MIRAAVGESVSRFVSAAFLDLMSHFCFIKIFAPCEEAKCEISDTELEAIPISFINKAIGGDTEAFDDVGGETFIRKKIAQLIKIAKSENEIQLDLVLEMILYIIGMDALLLSWKDGDGITHWGNEPIDYQDREDLLREIAFGYAEDDIGIQAIIEQIDPLFGSLGTLISEDESISEYVFFDDDFTFLLEDVPDGLYTIYKGMGDYDRTWLEKPWTDIGEDIPPAVTVELDAVEVEAINFGGVREMHEAHMKDFAGKLELK